MIFVTACDHSYFDYLLMQIANVDKYFGLRPLVYDLGLTDIQRDILGAMYIRPIKCPPVVAAGYNYPNGYRPRALFKPMILVDICDLYNTDVVYLDVDARPIKCFEFPVSELGLAKAESWNGSEYTGPYHSGVMFLGNVEGRMKFLMSWARDMWRDALPSDKKSLNRILERGDIELTILRADEYNSKFALPQTRIVHTK